MFRRVALALAVLAWMVPAQVFALGLGNIEMRSALNQPLDARIELLRAKPGELSDITVNLASVDTFTRAGIDRPSFLSDLKFEVVTNPSGAPYIQARSTQPITEAFLNFLIEVNWPNGRLLREFTVLVDPPVVTERAAAPVEAPALAAPETPSSEGQLVDQLAAEALGQVATPPSGAIEVTRPTQADQAAQPDAPVTIPAPPVSEPEAVAAAPSAAIEIPSEIESRRAAVRPEPPKPAAPRAREPEPASTAEPTPAAEGGTEYGPVKANETLWEIAQRTKPRNATVPQMMIALLENNPEAFLGNNINNLRQGAVLRLSDPGMATNISKDEAMRITDLQWEQWKNSRGTMVGSAPSRAGREPGDVAPSEARLKLVSPDAGDDAGDGNAPGAAAAAGGTGSARLRKELSIAQEALDVQRRETKDMRERVSSLEEQLATMQRLIQLKDDQLAAMQGQAAAPTPTEAATTQPAAAPAPAAAAAAGGEAPKAEATPTAAPAPTQRPGLVAGLMNDPKLILLGVVGVGVIVLLVWLFVRRRKMQQFQESILTLNEAVSEPSTGSSKPESEDASFMSDFAVSSMEGIQTEISEVDPLSEADVYLAYGRYKQAEELINQAIEKDPQRAELKMKLMEIHYAAKDAEAFELQAELVRDSFATQHPEMWARVLEMGRELSPENAMFSGASDAGQAAAGAGDEFDLGDLNFDDELAAHTDAGAEDLSLDFDLSGEGKSTNAAAAATAKAPSDDNALDFDLGDLKFDGDAAVKAKDEPAKDDRALDFDLAAFEKATSDEPEQAAAATADVAGDENALDFDFSSFGKSDDKASDEISLDATAGVESSKDEGLDFDFTPSAKNVPARDAKIVDFNASGTSGDDHLIDQPSSEVALADGDIDAELDGALFAEVDEVGTKLDLAKAYIDMGDSEGARSILDEVMEEGNANQKEEAQVLMRQIG